MKILNRFNGDVIFEDDSKTMKETVENAIKQKADLRSANLRSADLSSAYLRSAYLSSADLRSAYLSFADLSFADLSSADLSFADLSSADLRSADLRSADLSFADLSFADLSSADLRSADLSSAVKVPVHCKWTHGITTENLIHIGCEKRTVKEWDAFFKSDEVISTERNTQEFKQIRAVYESYKAYLKWIK